MRFLLSLILVSSGTALLCHGFFLDKEARAYLDDPVENASANQLTGVQERFPYSPTSVEARQVLVNKWKPGEIRPIGKPLFEQVVARVGNGFVQKLPYVDPFAVGAIALVGLLLAGLMPGTRFRGTVWTMFLLGGAGLAPSYLEPAHQANIVEKLEPTTHVLAHFPWIATGLLVFAGLLLGAHRSGRRDD